MFFRYFQGLLNDLITRTQRLLLAGVIVVCCFVQVCVADAADNPKILVLHSYHSGFQWTDDLNAEIIKALRSAYPKGDVFVEFMNTKRVPLDVMSPVLLRNYATLFRKSQPDVIIASDNNALDFMLKHGDKLFPGVPVVFCGINNFDDYNLDNRRNYTGVREDIDVGATLDVALRFHPGTHTVALIADVTESSQITLRITREVAKKYENVRFVELSGLSETVLAEKLAKLEQGTIILLLTYFRSPEGRVFSVKDSTQLIQRHTHLPVYTLWDFYMFPPVIGGKILTGTLQGKAAAEIAIRILKGEKPETIAPYSSPTSYYFNYDALQKFNIPDSLIPADSIIAGKPDTLYARYKTYIQGGVAFALSLIITILILLRGIVIQRRNVAALHASEEKYRVLFENSIEGIFQSSPEGRFLSVNPSLCRILGYDSPNELIGAITDSKEQLYVNPEDRDILFPTDPGNDKCLGFEVQIYRKNGQKIWVSMSTRLERDTNGRPVKLEGIVRDITERRRLEEELRTREQYQRALLDNFPFMVWLKDTESRLLAMNRPSQELAGLAADAPYYGKTDLDLFPAEMAEGIRADDREVMASGQKKAVEELLGNNEVPRWHEIYKAPVYDDTGKLLGLVGFARDITERKEMEEALAAHELEFRALAENSPDYIARYDRDCRRVYINPALEKMLGRPAHELLGMGLAERPTLPDTGGYYQAVCGVLKSGQECRMEFPFRTAAGEPKWGHLRIVPEFGPDGKVVTALAICRDITERKRAEEQLQETLDALRISESRYHDLFKVLPVGVFEADAEGNIVLMNDAGIKMMGGMTFEEIKGHGWATVIHPDDRAAMFEKIERLFTVGEPFLMEYRQVFPDGRTNWVLTSIIRRTDTGGGIGAAVDITDRKELESALRKSSHLLEEAQRIAEMGSWQLDLTKNTIRWSDEIFRIFAIKPYQLDSSYEAFLNVVHPDDRDMVDRLYSESVEKHIPCDIEHRLLLPDGRIIHVHERCETYYDAAGAPLRTVGTIQDITERKRMESALLESEQQFRTLTENSPNIIIRYDRECCRIYVNPTFAREIGIPVDVAQNSTLDSVWFVGVNMPMEEYRNRLRQVMDTGMPAELFMEWPRPDTGQNTTHIFNLVPEKDHDGVIIGCLAIGHNITERRKAERDLRNKREQLANVARELSVAEERERLRIASVLHDHIGQILLLAGLKLGALAAIPKPAPIESVIDEVRDLLYQATEDAHSLTVQLNPPMLSVSGLESALQWLGRKIESDYSLVVEFSDDLRPKPLIDEFRSILYQCARELLINAAKHAKTDRARISVSREDDMYRLIVEDHGVGFDLTSVSPEISSDCRLGLFSIQVRIERLGGSMEIETSPGNGTRITMRLPVKG